MSALLRKEARLLLPAWMGALAAAILPLMTWQEFEGIWIPFFGVAVLALVLSPFGQETNYGTFGLMLIQPEDRRRFWRIKTGLLALALVSAWMTFASCLWWSPNLVPAKDLPGALGLSALLMLAAFSGGLWTTLLLRDMVSALFCTCLVPTLIWGAALALLGHWIDPESHRFSTIVYYLLAAYAVAGFWWARRLFIGAQDVPWTGGQISLRSGRGLSLRWLAFEFTGRQHPWMALAKKEMQLQEVTMVLVPILALLHLAFLAIQHFAPHWITHELVAEAIPIIWLAAVPGIIGCVSVSEERRFNTLESHLCLPVSKRASFAVKLVVTLTLGIVLGGIVPWVLGHMGGMKMAELEFLTVVEVAAIITGVAFYASTMSRGLLQAIPTVSCIPVPVWIVIALIMRFTHYQQFAILASSLLPTLAWPAGIITLIWLAFGNYQRLQTGWRIWLGNLTRAAMVTGGVSLVAIGIFDRDWELLLPLEPHHGPARISGAGRAGMGVSHSNVCILLPDGRLWVGSVGHSVKDISGGFARDSNWVELKANNSGAAALQSDGTLWKILNQSDIRQIGSDSDWEEIAAGGGTFMAVKRNGTLWGWGNNEKDLLGESSNQRSHSLLVAAPIRIGDESDWANIFVPNSQHAIGVKRDGSTWEWGYVMLKTPDAELNAAMNTPREYWEACSVGKKIRANMEGGNCLSMTATWQLTLGLRNDGSLWAAGKIPSRLFGERTLPNPHSKIVRVGTKSDWAALCGDWQLSALEANGALWTMEYEYWDERATQNMRPSHYTDWLAVAQYGQLTWALAKDGTLSCWNEFGVNWPDDKATFMQKFFLGPSRRPILSMNILSQ